MIYPHLLYVYPRVFYLKYISEKYIIHMYVYIYISYIHIYIYDIYIYVYIYI